MDFIISFFRDTLDGPLYIVVTIICVILICSCIGYLAEQSLNKKKQKQEYDATHATVTNDSNQTLTQPNNLENVTPINTQQMVNQAPQQVAQPQMQNTYAGVPNNMEQPINMPTYAQPQMNTTQNMTQQVNSIPQNQQQPIINIDPQMISQAMGTIPPQPNIANTIPDVNGQINKQ